MAAIFLKAKSYEVGLSLIEDGSDIAARLMETAAKNGVKLFLPVDVVVTDEIGDEAEPENVLIENIPADKRIVDIGTMTVSNFTRELFRCKAVFWNGPMGIYEIPQFARGTQAMAELLAGLNATTIVGGGSTAEVVAQMKLADKISFVSTGGGASLRFLGGETLPGVAVLLGKETSLNG